MSAPGCGRPWEDPLVDETRPLNEDERSVLDLLLSVEFDGVAELREQARAATVVDRCSCGCPSVQLAVHPDAPKSSCRQRLSPVEAEIAPADDEAPGEVMMFLSEGRLSYMELVYYGDSKPDSWPPIHRMSAAKVDR